MARVVNSVAPIRICDLGGWTDTWFAETGCVLNISVSPYVQCRMVVKDAPRGDGRVVIDVANYGDRLTLEPGNVDYGKHPLLAAAVDAMTIPRQLDIDLRIHSEVPAGCSTGTSAAVTVALLGALDALTPGRMAPRDVAARAHEVETRYLGLQCGIQDQIASAHGGICYIEMARYPDARVCAVQLTDATWTELESRLSLIFLGETHTSSDVHKRVIGELEDAGPDCPRLANLRRPPVAGRQALLAGDFDAFGAAMRENTEMQAELSASLVPDRARQIFEVARKHGATGWKVNGAGGAGGSVTLLSDGSSSRKQAMLREIEALDASIRPIPIRLSRSGMRVWETPSTA